MQRRRRTVLEKEVCVYEEGDAAVTFLPLRTKIRLTPTKLAHNSQMRQSLATLAELEVKLACFRQLQWHKRWQMFDKCRSKAEKANPITHYDLFFSSYTCSVLTGLFIVSGGKNSLSFTESFCKLWLEFWVYICRLSRISLHLSPCYLTPWRVFGCTTPPNSIKFMAYKHCRL